MVSKPSGFTFYCTFQFIQAYMYIYICSITSSWPSVKNYAACVKSRTKKA